MVGESVLVSSRSTAEKAGERHDKRKIHQETDEHQRDHGVSGFGLHRCPGCIEINLGCDCIDLEPASYYVSGVFGRIGVNRS